MVRDLWSLMGDLFKPALKTKDQVIDVLHKAQNAKLIHPESRQMMEGVMKVADLKVRDVMISSTRMDMIDIAASFEEILNQVIDIAHSRYPVYEDHKENIIGILLAKDLLKLQRSPTLNLRTLLRSVVMVPESKSLVELLKEFRMNRNHLAVVIDEFGRVAGLVTIEDVLEEIVGDIEDEFDTDDEAGDIFALVDRTYRVAGRTALKRIAQAFELNELITEEMQSFETIAGWIAHEMGHVPVKGEIFLWNDLRFEVMHTTAGVVKWFKVRPINIRPKSLESTLSIAPVLENSKTL
ncbi:MAG: CBS domain-containing protein [Betaproteobacteria bacterium]